MRGHGLLSAELDQKILSIYGLGLSYANIASHMREIYGMETNDPLIYALTDTVVDPLRGWQSHSFEPLYAILWPDAAFFMLELEGHVRSRAVYAVLGVDMDDNKNVMGVYVEESEGARHWLGVLSHLKQRGGGHRTS